MTSLPQQVGQDPITKALGYLSRQIDQLKKFTFNTTISGSITGVATSDNQTSGSQKTQVVSAGGTNIDFATATKQTDGIQKAQWIDSALVEKGDIIRTFKVTITLPNNTNPYSAGDVITDATGALSQLTNVAKAAGYGVTIVGVRVQTTDPSGLAGKNLRWHIFNDSITPIADNAAFAINNVNTDKREGTITVTMGTGTLSKVGQANYENISLNPVSRNIYLVLEHVDGGTPSAVSTVINAYFKCLLTN